MQQTTTLMVLGGALPIPLGQTCIVPAMGW